ncbi:MAG: radical SAM protein [Nitrospiraceae bacterium]|jgi:AdoMet-dependent heme synthase|nr:MAG: radical SAM protein [Nitrospiraceae bacterium]
MSISNVFEFFIQLHLTERCNLRCRHCYQTGELSDEMSLSEIKALIDEVSDMLRDWSENYNIAFAPSFNVTGGEPFLMRDIFSVLEELTKKGFDTYLLSNGILISRKKAETLAELGVKGVQISIEGPEDIHDSIRGTGSMSSSIKGIQNLLGAGIEVTLNTTLSDINASHFMDVIELASSLGVQRVGFSRLVPSGRGKGLLNSMLTGAVLKDLYTEIFSLSTPCLQIVTGDPVASQMKMPVIEDSNGKVPTGGCAAGVSGLTILPDGTVTPCRRLPVHVGNVRKDSLREIWATSGVLRGLRDKSGYAGKCGRCRRWAICRGCRAIAYAHVRAGGNGDYLAEDPQCFLECADNHEQNA